MHIAACKNNENMISFLLDMGANPNVVNQQGQTPVMKAAEYGHIQCIEILADAGSDMAGINMPTIATNCSYIDNHPLESKIV